MKRRVAWALLAWCAGYPAATAQDEGRGASAKAGESAPPPANTTPEASAVHSPFAGLLFDNPWTGPRVELGYRLYSLTDSAGGGAVNSATFAGFLPTGTVRAGGGLEAGGRAYEYGPTDALVSGNAFAGYQHLHELGRIVPYVVAIGELGLLHGKRFHTPVTKSLRGAGLEIGVDVNVVRSLYLGLGVSYMAYTVDGLAYDTFGLRLSLGL